MNRQTNLLIATAFVLLFSGFTQAQQLPESQDEHRWLQRFAGEWETETSGKMGPDQPAMEAKGTISSRMIGKFWIVNEMKTTVMNFSVRGLQTVGYDPAKKKYVGTWVDSSSDFLWHYEGTVDDKGTTLTLAAKGPSIAGDGKMAMYHDVYEFKSDDEMIVRSKVLGEDGEWFTFMKGTAKRKK